MAKTDLNTIKNWFKTGLKPTQAQFWNTWDSFWHKDETITQDKIENLPQSLDSKLNKAEAGLVRIGDYLVDNRGVKSGNIRAGNIIYGVGSLVPGEYIIALVLVDEPANAETDLIIILQYLL